MQALSVQEKGAREIHEELSAHFARLRQRLPELQAAYRRDHYVELVPFMPPAVHAAALAELERLFEERSKRRDLIIAMSGNTPRKLRNLDRDSIAEGSTVIPAIYRSSALTDLLEQVVGERVLPVPYVPEEYIASRLHLPGDVHGWHWDDYTWALVWIFHMPPSGTGGSLEYLKDAPWNHEDPQVEALVAEGDVRVRHPVAGSAYLLKANTSLHRVSPLKTAAERMIVCYSYASVVDLTRPVNHDSLIALCPDSHARHED